jgi:hypothetical protein
LIAAPRETQKRTVKPSCVHLGKIARSYARTSGAG